MYLNGAGVPQDYVEAVRWYRLAANGCVPLEAFDVWLSFAWIKKTTPARGLIVHANGAGRFSEENNVSRR